MPLFLGDMLKHLEVQCLSHLLSNGTKKKYIIKVGLALFFFKLFILK